MTIDEMTLDTTQSIEIKADIATVFRRVLHRLGEGFTNPQGESLQMLLESWPGGRWFRDRGNGIGHLWGHVQVIKPPTLLEICGPLMMSYPAANHLQYRFKAEGGVTCLGFLHRAMGWILPEHRDGLPKGWQYWLERIRELAARKIQTQR